MKSNKLSSIYNDYNFKKIILNLMQINKITSYKEQSNLKIGFFRDFLLNEGLIYKHKYKKNNLFFFKYFIKLSSINKKQIIKSTIFINKKIEFDFFQVLTLILIFLFKKILYCKKNIYLISFNKGDIKIDKNINIFSFSSRNIPLKIKIRLIQINLNYYLDLIRNLQAIIEIS